MNTSRFSHHSLHTMAPTCVACEYCLFCRSRFAAALQVCTRSQRHRVPRADGFGSATGSFRPFECRMNDSIVITMGWGPLHS